MLTKKSQCFLFCFYFVLLLTPCLLSATSGDWPQWRGPRRDGIAAEKGLLKQWPAGGPLLVWKAAGLGEGFSTVSVMGERLFTTGDRGKSSFVTAVNVADGKTLWSVPLGKSGAPGSYEGPRASPTLDGDLVYAVGQYGQLVCVEAATGTERWRKDYLKDFDGSLPSWGFAESPLVDGEKVIVTPGGGKGAIVALDKNTGSVLWRSKDFTDSAQYSSPIVAEIGGVRQCIQLTGASVAGLAADNGRLLWRVARRGETAVVPTPVYADDLVYVTSGYGVGCNLFKINEKNGRFGAEQVYANKVMVVHHGGVIKIGDFIYGYSDSKGWTCQEFKTGKVRWQEKGKLGKGCLVAADGFLYLRQEDRPGTVALIEASPDGYKEHGRFDPPNRSDRASWPHPVIAGGKLYLRDQDVLLCYDVAAK